MKNITPIANKDKSHSTHEAMHGKKSYMLSLNNKLYNLEAIKEAAEEFKSFSECKITEDNDRIIVNISPIQEDSKNRDENDESKIDETAYENMPLEFFNCVLMIMKNNGLV